MDHDSTNSDMEKLAAKIAWIRSVAPRNSRGDLLVALLEKRAMDKDSGVDISTLNANDDDVGDLVSKGRIEFTTDGGRMGKTWLTSTGLVVAAGEWITRENEKQIEKYRKNGAVE